MDGLESTLRAAFVCSLAFAALLCAGCASPRAPDHWKSAAGACDEARDAAACRSLATQLVAGEVPAEFSPRAEEVVVKACWSDALFDARMGADTRYRLCFQAGRHFSARAENAMEDPGTQARRTAAKLFLRACELGQPLGCSRLLNECLLLDDEMCREPPTGAQARQWEAQRRAREASRAR